MKYIILFCLLLSNHSMADFNAIVYSQNSDKQNKIFTIENKTKSVGEMTESETLHKDMSGAVVTEEKSTVRGSVLVRYEINHIQSGQKASVEVSDGYILFKKTSEGKSSESKERSKGKTIISSNFQRFVKENWPEISAGKSIEFRFASWERMETVGFEIFKQDEVIINGKKAIVLKMKPSSFIIAALVKPLIFKWSHDGSHLLELNGRVVPKQKDGSKWKDLDAEVVYTHIN